MSSTRIIILTFFLISGLSKGLEASFSGETGADIKISFRPASHSEILKFSNIALRYGLKTPPDLKQMKLNIDSAESVCQKYDTEIPAILHLARAEFFFHTNDFIHSYQEATIAMKMSEKYDDKKTQIRTYNFLGRYNLRTRAFKQSIEDFNNSIALEKKSNITGYIPANYLGIADVYRDIGDTTTYRKTLKIAVSAAIKEKDTTNLISGCYQLGSSLIEKVRDFRKADSLLNQSLKISLIKKDTGFISKSLANLGYNFYLEKNYDKAISSYNRSLSFSIPGKYYSTSANSLGNLGTIYRDLGETDRAIRYYHKAIQQAILGKDVYNRWWIYDDMNKLYLRIGDTANAYRNYVLFKTFHDSDIMSRNFRGLTDARIQYEAESQYKEFELLSLRIKNQRLLIYGSTGLFILSLAILILLLSRSKIVAKRRLSELNRKIAEVTQANLRQQMNPHFIFNTLNSIQYYMYQHDKLATNNYLTKFSSLMRKVLENSQHTSVPLSDELDALNLYLELEKIRFKDKFDFEIKIDDDIDPLLYKVPTMLIQPYVENSISHGLMPALCKGIVRIELNLKSKYISCTIEDNGIGREATQEKNKNRQVNHKSLATQITATRLDLVNTLYGTSLKTIYTDLKNDKGEPQGTRVEIHIPILT
jgi:tetratricopeptide (TPR) repeat protein